MNATTLFCALALALTPLHLGCTPRVTGPSAVGQGQLYRAGNERYDDFFEALHEMQVDLAKVDQTERDLRMALAEAVGAEEDASMTAVAKRVRKRLEALAEAGVGAVLDVPSPEDEEGKVSLEVAGTWPEGKDGDLLRLVEETARSYHKLGARMRRIARDLEAMPPTIDGLVGGLERTFSDPKRRAEIKKNLDDARQLVPLMSEKARQAGAAAEGALGRLKKAASTEAARSAVDSEPLPEVPSGTPAPKPAPRPAQPTPAPAPGKPAAPTPRPASPGPGAQPAPKPAPKPSPKPGGDFEP